MPIQNKALLVNFSAGIGSSFRVVDKKATKEVCADKNTAAGRAEVRKHLLPDEALQPLKDAIQEARDFHDSLTLPWSNAGDILRIDNYLDYQAGVRKHRQLIEDAKETFLSLWQKYCDEAPAQLGELYKATDFPSLEKVRQGIYFETKFLPLPSGQDFRVDLGEEELCELRSQVDAQIRATLFEPFLEPLTNMVNRLKEPDAVFRNTLVTNLQRLIKLVPPGDVAVDRLTLELEDLVRHDADTLRENKSIRQNTASKAQSILDKMSGYMPSINGEVPMNIVTLPMPAPAAAPTHVAQRAGFLC